VTATRWAVVARVGLACWFFGNLYEAVVDVPGLLADARAGRARPVLAPGSPVRYYAPTLPPTLAATATTLIRAGRAGHRGRAVTAAAALASAAAMTAWLVPNVNLRLLRAGSPMSASERRHLVRTWHRLNAARMGALAIVWWSLR
jgi:hypothetical protein